jgi:hypothetical protein
MDEVVAYQIVVAGVLSDRWYDWFENLTICLDQDPAGEPVTILNGLIADQAALRGILERIWDLNMTLLAVSRTGANEVKEQDNE